MVNVQHPTTPSHPDTTFSLFLGRNPAFETRRSHIIPPAGTRTFATVFCQALDHLHERCFNLARSGSNNFSPTLRAEATCYFGSPRQGLRHKATIISYHDTICRSSRRQISGGPVRGQEDEGQGEGRRFVKRKGLSGINHRRQRDVTAARLRNILPPMSCGLSHWYREAKQGWDGCFGFLPQEMLSIPPLTFDIRGIPSPNSLKKSFLPKDT